jgi:hypothetical protein
MRLERIYLFPPSCEKVFFQFFNCLFIYLFIFSTFFIESFFLLFPLISLNFRFQNTQFTTICVKPVLVGIITYSQGANPTGTKKNSTGKESKYLHLCSYCYWYYLLILILLLLLLFLLLLLLLLLILLLLLLFSSYHFSMYFIRITIAGLTYRTCNTQQYAGCVGCGSSVCPKF